MNQKKIEINIPHEADFNSERFEKMLNLTVGAFTKSYARSIVHPNHFLYTLPDFDDNDVWYNSLKGILSMYFKEFSNKPGIRLRRYSTAKV